MSSDLRNGPDGIAGDDWWLLQPHARRLVILVGLAVIAVLLSALVAIRPDPADAGGAGGGGQVRGQDRANVAAPLGRTADSAPTPG
jgi:hypothetical protein